MVFDCSKADGGVFGTCLKTVFVFAILFNDTEMTAPLKKHTFAWPKII